MGGVVITPFILLSGMAVLSITYLFYFFKRSDLEVWHELTASRTSESVRRNRARRIPPLTANQRRAMALFFGGSAGLLISGTMMGVLTFAGIALCLSTILAERRKRTNQQRYAMMLEYQLPLLMERLVMAVQSGRDVLSGIKVIVEHEACSTGTVSELTRLLERALNLTESGVKFEDALQEVADSIKVIGVKHAFIHLALAHREGGELVMPLRELSDATQLAFQERVEEQIAALPVKATFPLLITFAGLLLIFMTPPLMSVMAALGRGTQGLTIERGR